MKGLSIETHQRLRFMRQDWLNLKPRYVASRIYSEKRKGWYRVKYFHTTFDVALEMVEIARGYGFTNSWIESTPRLWRSSINVMVKIPYEEV